MYIAVEALLLAQDAQRLDHELDRVVCVAHDPAGQEQPLDVVAAVEADGQVRQLARGEGGARDIVGTTVDAVGAIASASVAHEHFEQGDATPIGRERMAQARTARRAQLPAPARPVQAARSTGRVIFGGVGEHFELSQNIHAPYYTEHLFGMQEESVLGKNLSIFPSPLLRQE